MKEATSSRKKSRGKESRVKASSRKENKYYFNNFYLKKGGSHKKENYSYHSRRQGKSRKSTLLPSDSKLGVHMKTFYDSKLVAQLQHVRKRSALKEDSGDLVKGRLWPAHAHFPPPVFKSKKPPKHVSLNSAPFELLRSYGHGGHGSRGVGVRRDKSRVISQLSEITRENHKNSQNLVGGMGLGVGRGKGKGKPGMYVKTGRSKKRSFALGNKSPGQKPGSPKLGSSINFNKYPLSKLVNCGRFYKNLRPEQHSISNHHKGLFCKIDNSKRRSSKMSKIWIFVCLEKGQSVVCFWFKRGFGFARIWKFGLDLQRI